MIVDVKPGMTLAQVIVQLREAHGDSVTIRISPDASLLLTANEFRALALAAEREQVAIAVESSDGLRRQLASLFGVPLAIPVDEDDPELAGEDARENGDLNEEVDTVDPNDFTTTTTAPDDDAVNSWEHAGRKSGGVSLGKLGAGIAALGLIAAVGLAAYWLFFREATVTLELESQPVTSTIAFSVIRPGVDPASAPGAIPSEPVSFDLNVTLDAPATGQESVGGTTATGSLVLRNPGSNDVVIPAGTTIDTFEGDVFIIATDVTVPAASDGNPGEVTADITAATPGPAGNRDTGMLSGQLPNGVYYSNRATPVAGGTDVTRTVVTQEDLDGLQARAEETLRSLAANSVLSGDRRVVPSSLTIQQFTTDFSEVAGAEAESVSIDATISFDALAFSTTALDPAAAQALSAQTPPGHTLATESIVYQVPVETGEANDVISMLAQIDGQARSTMSDDEVNALVSDITGKSEQDAVDILLAQPQVIDASIEFSPGWLPHRLPSGMDSINVVLAE